MVTQPIISVRNVSKEYRLGELTRSTTLRDAISGMFSKKARAAGKSRHTSQHFWALNNVSFDVAEGEVLGIIGANGAGKSTLLKILSRITEPSTGEIELRGRVASLLEVGTGFNDELTGRENIILNGAILGMTKREIDAKFDEIVEFSGVERFIDTPVKHFSSGMKMRLAFAVAAHLEPEILIIDEVLAVGDAEFQRKCLGKMDDVARSGRTVLFVSHNMAAVESLCMRALFLRSGAIVADCHPLEAIKLYNANVDDTNLTDLRRHPNRVKGLPGLFESFGVYDHDGAPLSSIPMGSSFTIRLTLRPQAPMNAVHFALHFYDALGQRLASSHTAYQHGASVDVRGPLTLTHTIERFDFMPGVYRIVAAAASDQGMVDRIDPVFTFEVTPRDVFGNGKLPAAKDGIFLLRGAWRFEPVPAQADLSRSFN